MVETKKGVINVLRSIRNINPMVIVFILLLVSFVFLFARTEFIENTEVHDQFMREGKNPFFEAMYWLVTTSTTTGYGDYVPITHRGKMVAMFAMALGVSFLGFILTRITQRIISTNLRDVFGINRTRKKVDYVICGWNELSESVYRQIQNNQHHIIIIDPKESPGIIERNVQYIKGDPKDALVLEKANIKNTRNAILCMENDSDVLLTLHLIRQLNPWVNVVAKINNYEHVNLAEHAGADQVVSPSAIAGRLLSIATEEPYVVKWVLNATTSAAEEEFIEYQVTKESMLHQKTIAEASKLMHNAKIIGFVTHKGFEKFPLDEYVLKSGDRLVLMTIPKKRLLD
ncbi:NAD-binding protein [Candidatus Woesearchaeota archaeon]|nr:NAD-binding protein [Candidatus Woesearchaeota archaeon]